MVYHRAVKKTAGLKNWNSNHLGCQVAGISIFSHLLAKSYLGFVFSLLESSSRCLTRFKYIFRYGSRSCEVVLNAFSSVYDVKDVFENPLRALLARIDFVQNHEPVSCPRF